MLAVEALVAARELELEGLKGDEGAAVAAVGGAGGGGAAIGVARQAADPG